MEELFEEFEISRNYTNFDTLTTYSMFTDLSVHCGFESCCELIFENIEDGMYAQIFTLKMGTVSIFYFVKCDRP